MEQTLVDEKARQLQWEIEQQHIVSERIEAVRQETEQLFNAAVPLCVINTDYTVYRVNDTFCELFDCRKNEVNEKPCYAIWKSSLCNTGNCPLRNVLRNGNSFNTEGRKITSAGVGKTCMVTAKPFYNNENQLVGIVENFIDITIRKEMEEELERKKLELSDQNILLERKNSALRELMEQIRLEKQQTETQIMDNVEYMIRPLIEKLKACCLGKESAFIEMIETNITELTSPFGKTLARNFIRLSPKEITVCNMIKNGLDTKEIANLLHLSVKTVETHRKNIRKKLGISKSHENLFTCLTSSV